MAGDETADLWAELKVTDLAVLEKPHETLGVIFENILICRKEPAIPGDEAIKLLPIFFAECEE